MAIYKYHTIRVYQDLFDRFEYLYPSVCKTFVKRCLELALQDKKFLEDVIFNPYFMEVK